ncbi:MAG: ABC-F family ATP-binding cassette domain-containing protein [Candidatus Absconditabacteria bacterium]
MQYLQVKNIKKSYTQTPLFDGVSFAISKGQKIAIVAKNGAGKSTLLKALVGKIDLEDGEIQYTNGISIGFLSQDVIYKEQDIVLDILYSSENPQCQLLKQYHKLSIEKEIDQVELSKIVSQIEESNAWEYEAKIKAIISNLKIQPFESRLFGSLSGGEAKRVALAKTLMEDPDFLILDEPTNHLDLKMIEWLENYLNKANMTILMVTHDRYFLERVCNGIFELEGGEIYRYDGNYDYYLEKKEQREELDKIYAHKLKRLLHNELQRIRKMPRARETKSVDRENRFAVLKQEFENRKKLLYTQGLTLHIGTGDRRLGDKVIKINNLNKAFGEKNIVKNFSYDFKNGERVGIIGDNGVGKTTFIKMIMGLEEYDAGVVKIGDTVVFGHYNQKDISFGLGKKVIDVVRDAGEFMIMDKGVKYSAIQLLDNFLFIGGMQHVQADSLSGGEKKRLNLLRILMSNPNFLVLDEPTNDLDLITLRILEDFLQNFKGCILIVSHDRFFMDKLVDHLFIFRGNGEIQDYWGTYSQFKEYEEERLKEEKKETKLQKEYEYNSQYVKPTKLSYKENKELEQLEKEIQQLETRKGEIEALFYDVNLGGESIQELSKEMGEIQATLAQKETRWMELGERL